MSEADYTFILLSVLFTLALFAGLIFTIYSDIKIGRTSRRAREKHLIEMAVADAMMNCLQWQKDRQNGPGH